MVGSLAFFHFGTEQGGGAGQLKISRCNFQNKRWREVKEEWRETLEDQPFGVRWKTLLDTICFWEDHSLQQSTNPEIKWCIAECRGVKKKNNSSVLCWIEYNRVGNNLKVSVASRQVSSAKFAKIWINSSGYWWGGNMSYVIPMSVCFQILTS